MDGDCQHINEVFDAVPWLMYDDNNDVVSSLSVIPNEIVAYIIHLVLLSDFTMLGAINRVSETFNCCYDQPFAAPPSVGICRRGTEIAAEH